MRLRTPRRYKPVVSGASPPAGPSITSISPTSASQYDDAINPLTVNGSGFNLGDVVRLDGVNLATTYLSSTQLTAVVPATSLYTSGSKSVDVNGTSNTATLTVTAWSPASMTGVTAWWRADDIVESPAGFIQTFNAKVGSYTMTQATSANRPELVTSSINGKPAARRNSGISQFMTTTATFANLFSTTDATMLVVGAMDSIAAATQIFFSSSSGGTYGIYGYSAGNALRGRHFDGTFDEVGIAYTTGNAAKFEWRHTGGTLYIRNGSSEAAVASGASTSTSVTMGFFQSGTGTNTTRIAECICLNVAISATDRIRYNNYCADRYAL